MPEMKLLQWAIIIQLLPEFCEQTRIYKSKTVGLGSLSELATKGHPEITMTII